VKLFVLDPRIYRQDLVASLERMPAVEVVGHAGSVRDAWDDPALLAAELVILDPAVAGSGEFIGAVGARVMVCSSDCSDESVLAAVRAVAAAANARRQSARLTDREQQVLALIADGHPTREVAQQLCYSERTVKNVLHDVVTKLNARSRSQAVAFAVREGLI
jgi:DNA-binding NarL/FixJ family response regulator